MLENLFCESLFTIQCILGNKIMIIILVNTYATRFVFIDKKFVEIVYKKFEIQPQCLIKPKPIEEFDGRATKLVTHTIYLILSMEKYTKSLALLQITKLGQYSMILSRLQVKKHGILLDIINNSITFFPRYYTYFRAFLSLMPKNLKRIKIMLKAK